MGRKGNGFKTELGVEIEAKYYYTGKVLLMQENDTKDRYGKSDLKIGMIIIQIDHCGESLWTAEDSCCFTYFAGACEGGIRSDCHKQASSVLEESDITIIILAEFQSQFEVWSWQFSILRWFYHYVSLTYWNYILEVTEQSAV